MYKPNTEEPSSNRISNGINHLLISRYRILLHLTIFLIISFSVFAAPLMAAPSTVTTTIGEGNSQIKVTRHSSGSSGGSITSCSPNWINCQPVGDCINSKQKYECYDDKCTKEKGEITEKCGITINDTVEGEEINITENKTAEELLEEQILEEPKEKPPETAVVVPTEPLVEEDNKDTINMIFLIGLVLIILALFAHSIYSLIKSKKEDLSGLPAYLHPAYKAYKEQLKKYDINTLRQSALKQGYNHQHINMIEDCLRFNGKLPMYEPVDEVNMEDHRLDDERG